MIVHQPATGTPPAKHSHLRLVLIGCALVLAGPIALGVLFDHPLLRSTGLPAWPPMVAGCIAAGVAARADRRFGVWLLAGLAMLGTLAFAWGFWVFARMPATDEFARLERAPDFTLPDQDGTPVSLADLLARGPVHLVFYRGFW